MKFVTFKRTKQSDYEVGILDKNSIIPIEGIKDMQDLILKYNQIDFNAIKPNLLSIESIIKCAPIPHPSQDIICLGINYLDHAEESARFKKEEFGGKREEAVYFGKRVNVASGDGAKIPIHNKITQKLDYEVELGVIISKDAYQVSKENAFEYVFGYTIINDISARDIQLKHKQWYYGKSLEGATPMGPCIVTKDEFSLPPKLEISSYVNGELRQKSSTTLLIFDIAYVIAELSAGMVLKSGSIISMGTPSGVGMGFEPPKFLKIGDEIECKIEGIGSLKNTISE